MADEKFPEVEPGQPIKASRANEEGRVLERVARMLPGTGMSGRHGGSLLQFGRTKDARLATLKVTDDADAPVYLGVFRLYNFETGAWTDGTKPWKIDAGAVGTTLARNNIIVAYYDRKRGAFIPVVGGSGGAGARVIRFQILAAGPYLGDMVSAECDSVRAEVLDVSCSGAGVNVGDEVTIWDPSRCHFNIPIEMLLGANGMAVEMVSDIEGVVDCYDALQEEGACLWMVQSLCCTEDIYGEYGV